MKTFFYIFKRILIGTGISLLIGLIRGKLLLNTYAMEVWPGNIGTQTSVKSTQDTGVDFNNLGDIFSDQTGKNGYIYFNFSTYKVSGSSTDPVLIVRGASINTGDPRGAFICDIGSSSLQNSTFGGASYTAKCPVVIGTGVSSISLRFVDFQNNSNSTYRIVVTSSITFEVQSNTSVNIDTSGTTNAINNQITNDNTNTQNIINNQDTNTQNIINNQNTNTDKEIESQKACTFIDNTNIVIDNSMLNGWNNNGTVLSNTGYGITDYISVAGADFIPFVPLSVDSSSSGLCFYNINKSVISCFRNTTLTLNTKINVPSNASFVRFSINKNLNEPQFKYCTNGNQAIVDSQNNINNTLNSDDITGANSEASSFFSDFQANNHGLSGIITAPLRLLNSLSSSSCSPLSVPLPFVNNNVTLPCMSSIYSTYFSSFLSLYQLITTGLIAYWVLIKLFGHVKGMQDPKDDRIEVLQL